MSTSINLKSEENYIVWETNGVCLKLYIYKFSFHDLHTSSSFSFWRRFLTQLQVPNTQISRIPAAEIAIMIIRGTGSGSSSSSEASGWTEIKVSVINYYISVLQNSICLKICYIEYMILLKSTPAPPQPLPRPLILSTDLLQMVW